MSNQNDPDIQRDTILKRMLTTPPKPKMVKKSKGIKKIESSKRTKG